MSNNVTKVCLGVCGAILIAIGIIGLVGVPRFIEKAVTNSLYVSQGGGLYNSWQNGTSDYNIYVFNLTNADAVLTTGAVPQFTQVGPYLYLKDSVRDASSLIFNDNGTVFWKKIDTYTFVPEKSIDDITGRQLSESDIVINVNSALSMFADMAAGGCAQGSNTLWGMLGPTAAALGVKFFQSLTVKQFIFGYNDTLLKAMNPAGSPLFPLIVPANDKKYSEEHTGQGTAVPGMSLADSLSTIVAIQGMKVLPYWRTAAANRVGGWSWHVKQHVDNADILPIWVNTLSRIVNFGYVQDVTYKDLTLKRFTLMPSTLAANADFYMAERGIAPVPPAWGLPFYLSKPYYLEADTTNVNVAIGGINPPQAIYEKHNTFLHFEPMSGIPFQALQRLQFNTKIYPRVCNGTNMPLTANLPTTYVPLFWVQEINAVSDSTAQTFANSAYLPIRVGYIGGIILVILGGLLFIAVAAMSWPRPEGATDGETADINMSPAPQVPLKTEDDTTTKAQRPSQSMPNNATNNNNNTTVAKVTPPAEDVVVVSSPNNNDAANAVVEKEPTEKDSLTVSQA